MLDNYQWESILRSVSAHRSYRWVYEADYRPTNIADYLILNRRMPRSLAFCYRNIAESLNQLTNDYGVRQPAHDAVEQENMEAFILERVRSGAALPGTYPPNAETRAAYEASRKKK